MARKKKTNLTHWKNEKLKSLKVKKLTILKLNLNVKSYLFTIDRDVLNSDFHRKIFPNKFPS